MAATLGSRDAFLRYDGEEAAPEPGPVGKILSDRGKHHRADKALACAELRRPRAVVDVDAIADADAELRRRRGTERDLRERGRDTTVNDREVDTRRTFAAEHDRNALALYLRAEEAELVVRSDVVTGREVGSGQLGVQTPVAVVGQHADVPRPAVALGVVDKRDEARCRTRPTRSEPRPSCSSPRAAWTAPRAVPVALRTPCPTAGPATRSTARGERRALCPPARDHMATGGGPSRREYGEREQQEVSGHDGACDRRRERRRRVTDHMAYFANGCDTREQVRKDARQHDRADGDQPVGKRERGDALNPAQTERGDRLVQRIGLPHPAGDRERGDRDRGESREDAEQAERDDGRTDRVLHTLIEIRTRGEDRPVQQRVIASGAAGSFLLSAANRSAISASTPGTLCSVVHVEGVVAILRCARPRIQRREYRGNVAATPWCRREAVVFRARSALTTSR